MIRPKIRNGMDLHQRKVKTYLKIATELKDRFYKRYSIVAFTFLQGYSVEPRFNKVTGYRPNLLVKWRVRYVENLDIKNLRGKDQSVRCIKVIVND